MSTAETQIGVNTNLQQQDLSNLVSLGKMQLKKTSPTPKPKEKRNMKTRQQNLQKVFKTYRNAKLKSMINNFNICYNDTFIK